MHSISLPLESLPHTSTSAHNDSRDPKFLRRDECCSFASCFSSFIKLQSLSEFQQGCAPGASHPPGGGFSVALHNLAYPANAVTFSLPSMPDAKLIARPI